MLVGIHERLVSGLEPLFMSVGGENNCRTHAQDSEPALPSTQFAQINVAC